MPSPSLIAREDEFAAAEIVDAEPVPEPPADLGIVIAAARTAARELRGRGHAREATCVLAAADRLEADASQT